MAFLLGRRGRRQKEEAVEHTRKEVNFWKQELEYTVAEKNAWKEKFFDAYQQNDALRQQSKRLEMEKAHAEWERDRLAAGGPGQGADAAAAARGAPRSEGSLASGSSCPSSPEPPCLQRQLASARQQLRQADVRIAMLEERVLALQHERDLLGRQCELLTASEAAVQQEVVMTRKYMYPGLFSPM
ncbi:hypothetical protein MNEG_13244 [Monoraphidium neglectum]|uniref:Uncharacterized protein n=1 Tax=Monoraphidium neglectum TaxID=145388 RepID=A0A0D2LSX9_9CHLO|nr:hypothetical protein MNEG_13244 [Monoraphidium neglectum]KIY94719.1 hypothetical protein MNEG_13244 [Monoraphidium neglectum]|eukprot:XP_013893739.1 hypothetical protein MNEG_13244 [Monoraphidium neglectum]